MLGAMALAWLGVPSPGAMSAGAWGEAQQGHPGEGGGGGAQSLLCSVAESAWDGM